MREVRGEAPEETLFTSGLETCVAVAVRSKKQQTSRSGGWDKILAHLSSSPGEPDMADFDTQLRMLFDLDEDTDMPEKEVFVLVAPPRRQGDAQDRFNDYIIEKCKSHWDRVDWRYRDQSHLDEDGGSELWIDGKREVYWSVFQEPIVEV